MFRARSGVWRWRDSGWLAWLMVLAYLLHNFEQYGVDAEGRAFHFPVIALRPIRRRLPDWLPAGTVVLRRGLYFLHLDRAPCRRAVVSLQLGRRVDRCRFGVHNALSRNTA